MRSSASSLTPRAPVRLFLTGEPGGGGLTQGTSTVDVGEAAAKTRTIESRSRSLVAVENAGVEGPGATTGNSGGALAGPDVKVELTFALETDGATSGTGRGGWEHSVVK